MTIQDFITKAIGGGWKPRRPEPTDIQYAAPQPPYAYLNFTDYHPFLDPLAWQAVGKVEGWAEHEVADVYSPYDGEPMAINNMHRMIDALADGKSVEQFLETL